MAEATGQKEDELNNETDELRVSSTVSGENTMSSWWGSWYDTAKKKLAETNEFMQRDISEFTQIVQTDASKLVSATAATMKEKLNIDVDSGLEEASTATKVVKDSISNFLGSIQKAVGPIKPDDDENDSSSVYIGTATGVQVMSPAEARLHALRTDPATFCNEPDNEAEYSSWLEKFSMEDHKKEISTLMLDCSQIRALYTKLVPNAVSHIEFWTRYFYKLNLHDLAEKRRAKLVERAEKEDDNIEWDDEDWVQTPDSSSENAESSKIQEKDDTKQSAETVTDKVNEKATDLNTCDNSVPVNEDNSPNQSVVKDTDKPDIEHVSESVDNKVSKAEDKESCQSNVEVLNENTDTVPVPVSKESVSTSNENESPTPNEQINSNAVTTKSTPAPSKPTPPTTDKSSSEVSSDDWEKEFDLDMTEEEIKDALEGQTDDPKIDGEDWEDWE